MNFFNTKTQKSPIEIFAALSKSISTQHHNTIEGVVVSGQYILRGLPLSNRSVVLFDGIADGYPLYINGQHIASESELNQYISNCVNTTKYENFIERLLPKQPKRVPHEYMAHENEGMRSLINRMTSYDGKRVFIRYKNPSHFLDFEPLFLDGEGILTARDNTIAIDGTIWESGTKKNMTIMQVVSYTRTFIIVKQYDT